MHPNRSIQYLETIDLMDTVSNSAEIRENAIMEVYLLSWSPSIIVFAVFLPGKEQAETGRFKEIHVLVVITPVLCTLRSTMD